MRSRTLFLVRHGHTLWHDSNRIAGRSDIALSLAGRAAVVALRPSLDVTLQAARDKGRPVRWWASPLQRTIETARLLGGDDACRRTDARLVELDFGDWEGSTWDAVHRATPDVLAAWGEDWVCRSPPGGESFMRQIGRCRRWLGELQANGAQIDIVVAHGGTLRALMVCLLGTTPDRAMHFAIDPAHVCRFDVESGTGWRLRAWNLAGFS